MLETISQWDQQLFFFLNSLHTEWLDQVMFFLTQRETWIPFYVVLLIWMVKEYKWKGLLFALAAGCAVGLADFIISGLMKPFFQRYRPSRDPAIEDGLVHIVNGYYGGRYGFASSHAGTSFALATFVYLLFCDNYKWIILIFVWAALMSYTRIYLGVHYPGDIMVGALVGIITGYLFFLIAQRIMRKSSAIS
ncbi:MAG: phosphatase PAP2 family protein [Fulvivirga sp.]|nr:phosphatase PAP2 family protein [Fulvivirga sp.]